LTARAQVGYRCDNLAGEMPVEIRTLAVAALAMAIGAGCGKKAGANEIVVGHYASMTGQNATFGQSTDKAIQIAVEEINAAGGIDGKKIKLVTIDDAGKATEASVAVTRLIDEHGAKAILGEVASGLSLVGGPIAQEAGVPMISPSSTNPDVTKAGDMVFRVCFLDDFQGYAGAKFAKENLGATKVAILYDQAEPYSTGLANDFKRHFTKMGGSIVLEQAYTGANLEVSSQLQSIKSSGADVVYMPGYYNAAGTIIRTARDAGISIPFLGGDGWDSEELAKLAGPAIDGNYFTNHYSPEEDRPEVVNFVKKYREKFGATPDGLAALGYDSALVLFDAMKRAKSLGGADLRDAIAATKDFTGVTGTFSIDADRNAKKSAVVVEYKGGKQTIAARIEPPN
jgi:branched-chain amino acid transport system substrate-binding protein